MGVPIKKTVVIEANTHTAHRKISEIILTNFFLPPTGVRYLVTWLRLNVLLPFCERHPLSLHCKSVLKLPILNININICLKMNVIIKNIAFVVFSKRSMTICVCVCV